MLRALNLARKGKTTPNPMVGAVIVKKDQIRAMGLNSRKFVEEVHGHVKVASKFIRTWKK